MAKNSTQKVFMHWQKDQNQ